MSLHVTTLREAGFFRDYQQLSDAEILELLREKKLRELSAIFGPAYEPEQISDDYQLAALDAKKFVDLDLEADVCAENRVYEWVLQTFSEASGGYFSPTNITELWAGEEGPISVSFFSNGSRQTFSPAYLDDWIDGRVFEVINREMQKTTAERFYLCYGPDGAWFGQNAIYVRLSQNEKELLQERLRWEFPQE